ncbi:hypothetical protein L1856_07125 [Streptomyces sp. Tue 6430]|nr:hypothetical protein [Streptomyces sp. Tue 6430]
MTTPPSERALIYAEDLRPEDVHALETFLSVQLGRVYEEVGETGETSFAMRSLLILVCDSAGLLHTLLAVERPETWQRAAIVREWQRLRVRLRFPGGARDFVALLDGHEAASGPMETIAFEYEDPRMAGMTEVAFRWCSCPEERVRSFANSRPTVSGTHTVGFRDGMAAAVTAYAREQGLLTATDPDFGADQIGEGLTAVVSVKLDRPEFEGSTRGVLGNAEVRDCVRQAVQDHLGRWLKEDQTRAAAVIDWIFQGARRD